MRRDYVASTSIGRRIDVDTTSFWHQMPTGYPCIRPRCRSKRNSIYKTKKKKLDNVFVKYYSPNYMLEPKTDKSLKDKVYTKIKTGGGTDGFSSKVCSSGMGVMEGVIDY